MPSATLRIAGRGASLNGFPTGGWEPETPEALMELVNSLNTDLQRCGYRHEKRPFRVHLTLMRKAFPVKTLPPITPIIWTVEDFCLVRSTIQPNGANYEVIARW